MAFIKYVPEVPVERQEIITILPSGVLCINGGAKEYFEEFTSIVLLYDKERNIIGLQPTDEGIDGYPFSTDTEKDDIRFSVKDFLKHFEIPHKEKRKYRVSCNNEQDIFEIDLKKPL